MKFKSFSLLSFSVMLFMTPIMIATLTATVVAAQSSQTTSPHLEFDVASVRPLPGAGYGSSFIRSGGKIHWANNLIGMLMYAYRVQDFQVTGMPHSFSFFVVVTTRSWPDLLDGELDNRTPGKVTGWMRFFRNGREPLKVLFDLEGDFHEDIRGAKIRLSNPDPSDRCEGTTTYMEGFSKVQRGTAGDITSGRSLGPWTEAIARQLMERNEIAWNDLDVHGAERDQRRKEFAERYREHIAKSEPYYPYSDYPCIEWYSDNGRVVLELAPSQVETVEVAGKRTKSPAELYTDAKKRDEAMAGFLGEALQSLSEENLKHGGDGNVTGVVIS